MNMKLSAKALLRPAYFFLMTSLASVLYFPRLLLFRLGRKKKDKLHIGCGRNILPGWINADITPSAELIVFLERSLPFSDRSLRAIFSEHVLEHVDIAVARKHLCEAFRVLTDDGVLRIAMPDLDDIVECYMVDWRRMDWVNWPQFSHVRSRAQAINMAFRDWGHSYLYNREEIESVLREAGFTQISFQGFGTSSESWLAGLEVRPDSKLIVEARK